MTYLRAVFPEVPQHSPQAVLSLNGLTQAAERMLDVSSCLIQRQLYLLEGDVRLLPYFRGNGRKGRVRF
jgi:hypothetical protein